MDNAFNFTVKKANGRIEFRHFSRKALPRKSRLYATVEKSGNGEYKFCCGFIWGSCNTFIYKSKDEAISSAINYLKGYVLSVKVSFNKSEDTSFLYKMKF